MRFVFMLILSAIFASCASPPGAFREQDFEWKTRQVQLSHEEAFKRIQDGSRRCTGLNYFRPVGYLLPDKREAYFDIFLPALIGAESSYVGGRLEIFGRGNETTSIKIGILKKYFNPQDSMGLFAQINGYVDGKAECWEP